MDIEELWNQVTKWLKEEKEIKLPKGEYFRVSFDANSKAIEIVPTKTGIPRRVKKEEWVRFGEKFNFVKEKGYDSFRPGHYAQITYNSSYLVAILKEYGYSE